MFALIVILIWAFGHLYVGWSVGRFIQRRRMRWALRGAIGLHFGLTITAMSLRRITPEAVWKDVLQWAAYVGIGLFSTLFVMCVLRDLVLLGARIFRRPPTLAEPPAPAGQPAPAPRPQGTDASLYPSPPPQAEAPAADAPADPSRRALFQGIVNTGIVSASVVTSTYGYAEATRVPDVLRVTVPIKDLAPGLDGFKIVQISDIHVGPTIRRKFVQGVVDRIQTLDPDIVALTGDLIDGYVPDLRADVAPLGQLSPRYGNYFVTGNHEYYWDAPGWCDEMERLGWNVLNNAHKVITPNGARLLVGGVTDYSAARHLPAHKTDPHQAIAGAPPVDFRLLLAHQPKSIWEAAEAGFDMQISGHTHGGQFWPWNMVVGHVHPFSRGLDDYKNMKIYVSLGTGYWGPPKRVGAPSEITLLTLKRV